MDDPATVLIGLDVVIDEFVQRQPAAVRPGPAPALHPSEARTLAVCGQWARCASERDCYRDAATRLVPFFPRLPDRSQCTRQQRHLLPLLARGAPWLAARVGATQAPSEVLASTAAPTRTTTRRGRGWLAGLGDRGWRGRRGDDSGVHLLLTGDPAGVRTGWGFGPASTQDHHLAEPFFGRRAAPDPRRRRVGRATSGVDVAATGFAGRAGEARWVAADHAQIVCPPTSDRARRWPPGDRRLLTARRQVVEPVCDRLLFAVRLDRARPHTLDGCQARLAAKVARHNACIWCNRHAGRPDLALTEVRGWSHHATHTKRCNAGLNRRSPSRAEHDGGTNARRLAHFDSVFPTSLSARVETGALPSRPRHCYVQHLRGWNVLPGAVGWVVVGGTCG